MRLTDLSPRFVGAHPDREGIGLLCDCPCGCGRWGEGRGLFVDFLNPLDGGPPIERGANAKWQRTGETFETLTLSPSILRSKDKGGCGWHGYIENGLVRTG